MNRFFSTFFVLTGIALIGCEQKTESEKLADQMAKTGSAFEREARDMAREADRAMAEMRREVDD